jgi:hypothetical protein
MLLLCDSDVDDAELVGVARALAVLVRQPATWTTEAGFQRL